MYASYRNSQMSLLPRSMDMNTQTATEYSKTLMVNHMDNATFFMEKFFLYFLHIKRRYNYKNVCKKND